MRTRAAILYAPHTPFQIETLDLQLPRAGEVLVKVTAAGVCHSDWHLVTGATQHPLPVVAGHEGAGLVEAVGAGVTRLKPGDHVALNVLNTARVRPGSSVTEDRRRKTEDGRPGGWADYLQPAPSSKASRFQKSDWVVESIW